MFSMSVAEFSQVDIKVSPGSHASEDAGNCFTSGGTLSCFKKLNDTLAAF